LRVGLPKKSFPYCAIQRLNEGADSLDKAETFRRETSLLGNEFDSLNAEVV
jgi:hypothetical protein